jgi:pyrroline-5-carboxylate reductase
MKKENGDILNLVCEFVARLTLAAKELGFKEEDAIKLAVKTTSGAIAMLFYDKERSF